MGVALSSADTILADASKGLAVAFLTVLPLGILLYTFIERPGILLVKHVSPSPSKVEVRSKPRFKTVAQEGDAVRTPVASPEVAMPQYIAHHDDMSNSEVVV